MRKEPKQKRARERVDHILNTAEKLMIEEGVGNLKLNEVAERAGVPIGSVYQYFSGREEILRGLADRHHTRLEHMTRDLFSDRNSFEELAAGVEKMIDSAWAYVAGNPGYRELLCGVQSWEILRELDWADTIANAEVIASAFTKALPYVDRQRLVAFFTIMCDAAGSTARLALAFDQMQEEFLGQFRAMIQSHLITLLAENNVLKNLSTKAPLAVASQSVEKRRRASPRSQTRGAPDASRPA